MTRKAPVVTNHHVVCDGCGKVATFYPTSRFGPWYKCVPCDRSVGAHKDSGAPKGTLADRPTRQARMAAHAVFDPLWADLGKGGRLRAYEWMAEALQIPTEEAHVAMMDVDRCQRLIEAVTVLEQDGGLEAWEAEREQRERDEAPSFGGGAR